MVELPLCGRCPFVSSRLCVNAFLCAAHIWSVCTKLFVVLACVNVCGTCRGFMCVLLVLLWPLQQRDERHTAPAIVAVDAAAVDVVRAVCRGEVCRVPVVVTVTMITCVCVCLRLHAPVLSMRCWAFLVLLAVLSTIAVGHASICCVHLSGCTLRHSEPPAPP